jgi:hypothetical protein
MAIPKRMPRSVLLAVLVTFVSGCLLQHDQESPLELQEGEGAAKTIGAEGGVISVPPDFSLNFPAGALPTSSSVTVAPRTNAPFPGDGGAVLPGTAYDISPAGLALATPARVEIRVPLTLLETSDEVRLGVAILNPDGSIATATGTYDATSGFLSADLERLGPVAAVVELDAIDVESGLPPTLGGGNFAGAPTPSGGGAGASAATMRYQSSCSPDARRCFSSGLIRVWISQSLRDRIGGALVIVAPVVDADLDFLTFGPSGQPTSVVGEIRVAGTLKALVGNSVVSYSYEEHSVTGSESTPSVTAVAVADNVMVFANITGDSSNEFEFGLSRIATGELLTFRIEREINLENDDGSETTGTVFIHVRLRR